VARLLDLHDACQPRDGARRNHAGTPERGGEPLEFCAFETFLLKTLENPGEQRQIVLRPIGVVQDTASPRAVPSGEESAGNKRQNERSCALVRFEQLTTPSRFNGLVEHRGEPVGESRDVGDAQDRCNPARPTCRQDGRGPGPPDQPAGVYRGTDPVAQQREVEPQARPLAQLPNGLLPLPDERRIRRVREPLGEPRLAVGRASGAQVLEQRTRTEQIEIRGIRVVGVLEAGAVRTAADPIPRDPIQVLPVILRGVAHPATTFFDPLVDERDGDEPGDG